MVFYEQTRHPNGALTDRIMKWLSPQHKHAEQPKPAPCPAPSRRAFNQRLLALSATTVGAGIAPLTLTSPSYSATATPPSDEFRALLKRTINEASSFSDRFEAEVWLIDMSRRLSRYIKNEEVRLHILKTVHKESSRNQLKTQLVLSVIHVESLFDQYALSSAGARGLMQVMPFWKKELDGAHDNLFDIDTNIRYGCAILKTYLKIEKGSYRHALARYNGSTGKNWYPTRVFNAWEKYWYVNG